jgi:NitT/TauT family transport system ATP-binding protein
MTTPVLHVEGLRKVFGSPGTGEDFVVLDGVDLDVYEGELLSIIGPSGCGKTTLLHIVNGLEEATSGTVQVERESMATVFQRPLLLPWRTVLQNACFAMECRGHRAASVRHEAVEILERVGLGDFTDFYPHEISRGMRQRVDLARALLVKPRVLLMDEPYASLDVDTRRAMQDDLLALREEYRLTVLFVSHQLDEVVTLADRVVFLSAKPTRVRHETRIDLPRPRNRGLEGKIAFVKQVEALTGFFQK